MSGLASELTALGEVDNAVLMPAPGPEDGSGDTVPAKADQASSVGVSSPLLGLWLVACAPPPMSPADSPWLPPKSAKPPPLKAPNPSASPPKASRLLPPAKPPILMLSWTPAGGGAVSPVAKSPQSSSARSSDDVGAGTMPTGRSGTAAGPAGAARGASAAKASPRACAAAEPPRASSSFNRSSKADIFDHRSPWPAPPGGAMLGGTPAGAPSTTAPVDGGLPKSAQGAPAFPADASTAGGSLGAAAKSAQESAAVAAGDKAASFFAGGGTAENSAHWLSSTWPMLVDTGPAGSAAGATGCDGASIGDATCSRPGRLPKASQAWLSASVPVVLAPAPAIRAGPVVAAQSARGSATTAGAPATAPGTCAPAGVGAASAGGINLASAGDAAWSRGEDAGGLEEPGPPRKVDAVLMPTNSGQSMDVGEQFSRTRSRETSCFFCAADMSFIVTANSRQDKQCSFCQSAKSQMRFRMSRGS
mmetsp:Transcript_13876/g.40491  ORF Transcript_13876/g.40491 Transcript_13876/m.40491 type:complete len:476 (+) Transcript_13876:1692-3119(+)